jgi:hypothetical protein
MNKNVLMKNMYYIKRKVNTKNISFNKKLLPHEYKFILICATGRSGSTTLQCIVNSIPNANICGENNGSVCNLLELYNNIKHSINLRSGKENPIQYSQYIERNIKPSWYSIFSLEEIKLKIQELIIAILKPNVPIIGFKEIRWQNKTELLNTFLELFPNTKIICHIKKDTEAQSKSAWWKTTPNAKEILDNYNKELIAYFKNTKDKCYLTTFENIFNLQEMIRLFNFLDEKFNEEEYTKIINNNLKD